jgi:hypothetical protein
MASFAKLNLENIVEQVITVNNNELLDNGIESEAKGIAFCKSLFGQETNWKQTSYNTYGGVHKLGGTPFRKNFAGINFNYDEQRNAFIPPKPYNSWILNEETCNWEASISYPTDGQKYFWNEETQSWTLQTI